MKLRMLKHDSDIDEMMDYLEKRHPLYFINHKISKSQVRDLVRRLKYRLQSQQAMKDPPAKKIPSALTAPSSTLLKGNNKAPEVGKPVPLSSVTTKPTFKAGGALPTLTEGLKSSSKK